MRHWNAWLVEFRSSIAESLLDLVGRPSWVWKNLQFRRCLCKDSTILACRWFSSAPHAMILVIDFRKNWAFLWCCTLIANSQFADSALTIMSTQIDTCLGVTKLSPSDQNTEAAGRLPHRTKQWTGCVAAIQPLGRVKKKKSTRYTPDSRTQRNALCFIVCATATAHYCPLEVKNQTLMIANINHWVSSMRQILVHENW